MATSNSKPKAKRRNASKFLGARIALASGAAAAVLIGAQIFVNADAANATSAATSSPTEVAVLATATTTQTTSEIVLVPTAAAAAQTTTTTTVVSAQSQPVPSTHSSR